MVVIRRFWSSFRVFGFGSAFRVLQARLRGNAAERALVPIRVSGLSRRLWVRPSGTDIRTVAQIFGERQYQFSAWRPYKDHIDRVLESIISAGRIPAIVDAGANIGASSLWFAETFPECHVFAIEPDPENFDVLRKNIGSAPNVTALNCGLWDTRTHLSVANPTEDAWARRVTEDSSGMAIPSITVPDLLETNPKLQPLIVKIDIEGAEVRVFRSNTEWVDSVPLIIFEAHDELWHWLGPWQGSGHAFFSVLSRRKREYLRNGENVFAFLHPDEVEEGGSPATWSRSSPVADRAADEARNGS